MAKKKSTPRKVEKEPEPEVEASNGSRGLIKTLIIGGTFFAIAALSILTKGLDDNWPSPGVVVVRMVLLSICAAVYFFMLYRTRAARQNDEQKPQPGRK